MEKVTSAQFASSALWRFIDVISRKVVALAISIQLARLIAPEAYGVVALTMVFIVFCDIFILNGFNVALIRKEETKTIDYSTVMTMGLVFTSLMYCFICFFAPYFASFYESPALCPVLKVITLLLFCQSVSSVIRAKATREMQFKKMAIASFVSNIFSGVIALILAFNGYNVWALVIQQLTSNFIEMVMLLLIFRWKMSFKFSSEVAKGMTKFTLGVIGTSFLDFLGNNICSLVIGKSYSTKNLGYYNRANVFPETIGLNAYNSINSVLLPALSSRQSSDEEMKAVLRKVVSLTQFVIFPLLFGLIGTAQILIPVLLTDKWTPCIPFMYFCCLYYAINPIRSIGYSVFYAKGFSKHCVKIEIVRAILMVVCILFVAIVFKQSLFYVLTANLLISMVVAIYTQYKVRGILDYKYKELLEDTFPSFFMAVFMAVCMMLVGIIPINKILVLILQIIIGVLIYVFLSRVFKNHNYILVKKYIFQKVCKK